MLSFMILQFSLEIQTKENSELPFENVNLTYARFKKNSGRRFVYFYLLLVSQDSNN